MTTAIHDRHERILRKWNITQEMWDDVWRACKGHCPLCLKPFSSTRLPCVEHRHSDGLWRGLVCTDCNSELGYHHDNAAWFRRCADFLDSPPTLHEGITHYVPGSIGEHHARG